MFKFTQLIKENVEFEDIEDALLPIYDTYGEPHIVRSNIDGGLAYSLRWQINLSLYEYNDIQSLDGTMRLLTSLSELKSTQKRLTQFNIDFKIGGTMLFVRLIPNKKSKETGDYKFIIGQFGLEIQLKLSEIIRFYRDNGVKIRNIKYEEDEVRERCNIEILTDENVQVNAVFCEIFLAQYDEMKSIERDLSPYYTPTSVEIITDDDRTYIVLDADF